MDFAVVGHVEWVEFLRVEAVPKPGEIVGTSESWAEPAGGGGVAAVELARLAGSCVLFCRLGGDELGAQSKALLEAAGVRIHSPDSDESQRRGFCYVDEVGERTITVIGEKPRPQGGDGILPWEVLDEIDGVYFTAGDAQAVRQARRARVLVATAASCRRSTLRASSSTRSSQAGRTTPSAIRRATSIRRRGSSSRPPARSAVGRNREGPTRRPLRPGRSRTSTAPGTASRPGSRTPWRKGWRSATRSRSPRSGGALALTRRGAGLKG